MIRLSLRRRDVRLRQEAVERDGEDRGGGEREPDHAADGLHRADEGHHEDGELVEGQACPAAPEGEDARGDEREQPEERGRPARARPLPLAEDRRERRVDEHQLVVRDDVPPVRRREDAEGGEDDERQRDPREASCAHQLDEPEQHGEAGAEDDGAVQVRPEDEERQDEQRPVGGRRGAPASTSSQSDAGEERERGRLRAERPAPRAGEDREEADDEGRARRRAAGPRGREGEAEREQDEGDPEEDHGAHAREPVGGVEDDLGEPLLVGPRAPLAEDGQVLGVRQAVLDDLASGHQRQPRVADDDRRREDREEDDSDQADEEDREGARLEGAADSAPGNRLDTCLLHVVLGGWCPTEVGHRWGGGGAPRAHERIFARGSARLSGPRARVARDPCGWPVTSPITMLRA